MKRRAEGGRSYTERPQFSRRVDSIHGAMSRRTSDEASLYAWRYLRYAMSGIVIA